MQTLVDDLDADKFGDAYNLYSKCAQGELTADQLKAGKAATGTVTLAGVTVLRSTDTTATARVSTKTQFFVGPHSSFDTITQFIKESGNWRIDSSTPAKCQR